MSESKKEIKEQPWSILIKQVMEWEYGSVHSHEEILDIIGLEANYYKVISKANKYLLRKGKKLVSVYKQGYKVLKPEEYAGHSTDVFLSGRNRLMQAQKILECAPTEHMSEAHRRTHQRILERMRDKTASITGGCRDIILIQNPNAKVMITDERISMKQNKDIEVIDIKEAL